MLPTYQLGTNRNDCNDLQSLQFQSICNPHCAYKEFIKKEWFLATSTRRGRLIEKQT